MVVSHRALMISGFSRTKADRIQAECRARTKAVRARAKVAFICAKVVRERTEAKVKGRYSSRKGVAA